VSDAVLALLRNHGEAVRAEELGRMQGKLGEVSREDWRQIEAIAANIVEALLPLRGAGLTADEAVALRFLFSLEEAA
jgi:glutamyl-tRNAGlu reductase-like protein